jgi:hypothetical protein
MRTFYLDLALDDDANPQAGDVISGPNKRWLVAEAWPTDSKLWGNRWTLRIDEYSGVLASRRVIDTVPYRKGETPQDAFAAAGR